MAAATKEKVIERTHWVFEKNSLGELPEEFSAWYEKAKAEKKLYSGSKYLNSRGSIVPTLGVEPEVPVSLTWALYIVAKAMIKAEAESVPFASKDSEIPFVVGKTARGSASEYETKAETFVALFEDNKLWISKIERGVWKKGGTADRQPMAVAAHLALFPEYIKEQEFKEFFQLFVVALKEEKEEEAFTILHTLTSNAESRLTIPVEDLESSQAGILLKVKPSKDILSIPPSRRSRVLTEIVAGNNQPQFFGNGMFEGKVEEFLENPRKYFVDDKRVFSEYEKARIYQIPKTHEFTQTEIKIAERVKKTRERNSPLQIKNILLEGDAGSGKTETAKVLSAMFGLPYTQVTCFADMDKSDVTGAFYPVAENNLTPAGTGGPSEAEIQFDPQKAWMMLTGETLSDATPAMCEERIRKEKEKHTQEGPKYVFQPSQITEAFEKGWLLEIREPTCIADAAVLMALNSMLEDDGVLNLPDRVIKRHPDFMCVITTNRNYQGCRPLNEALRDRFQLACKMDLPEEKTLEQRMKRFTGVKNGAIIKDCCTAIEHLSKFLKNEGILGQAGTRSLANLIVAIEDGEEREDAFKECVLYKITTDEEDIEDIMSEMRTSTKLFNY